MLIWDKYENRYRTVVPVEDIKKILNKYEENATNLFIEIKNLIKETEEN